MRTTITRRKTSPRWPRRSRSTSSAIRRTASRRSSAQSGARAAPLACGAQRVKEIAQQDELEPERARECMRGRAHAELAIAVLHVRADRMRGDAEPLGDLAVGAAVREEDQHIAF